VLHRHHLIVTVVAALSCSVQADIIFVDAGNCPGPGDGSELDPYCSIQTAIGAALDTDEIVVAPGTYFETINFLGKAITVRSTDGPDVTKIDGIGNFHVVQCVSGEGTDTVLDGFVITGGNANGSFPDNAGGGMFNSGGSSPTVTNCSFSDNTASAGGGMYNSGDSNPTVTDCTFQGNTAVDGGGGMFSFDSSPTVSYCTFTGNSAFIGGGMYNVGFTSSPSVIYSVFELNSASTNGGGIVNVLASTLVTGCIFEANSASGAGGGMYNFYTLFNGPSLAKCRFNGNSAGDSGGAISNLLSNPRLTNCDFHENLAVGFFGKGGAMRNNSSYPSIINCTFSDNSANDDGGAIYNEAGSIPTVTSSILWDNHPTEVSSVANSSIAIEYSNVQGGFPGPGNVDANPLFVDPDNGDLRLSAGSPCIDAGDDTAVPEGVLRDLDGNPRFIADACAGDRGATVDMGAYEFQGTSCDLSNTMAILATWGRCDNCGTPQACPADFDGDCSVGIFDLLIRLGTWD